MRVIKSYSFSVETEAFPLRTKGVPSKRPTERDVLWFLDVCNADQFNVNYCDISLRYAFHRAEFITTRRLIGPVDVVGKVECLPQRAWLPQIRAATTESKHTSLSLIQTVIIVLKDF
nr:hypothetical protein CFP56_52853 [Quercus suber]